MHASSSAPDVSSVFLHRMICEEVWSHRLGCASMIQLRHCLLLCVQEYLGITGNSKFNELSAKLAFGESSSVIREGRNATVQALSGTGSLRVSRAARSLPQQHHSSLCGCSATQISNSLAVLCFPSRAVRAWRVQVGAEFLAQHYPVHTVLLPNPTWANHNKIFPLAGIKDVRKYRYFKPSTKGLDYEVSSTASSPSQSCKRAAQGVSPRPLAYDLRLEMLFRQL